MSRVLCPYQMAAQSAVAGLGVVIGSAIAFSWKSTDALDMERQRAMRHSMSGKVRLRTRDTLTTLHTQIWKRAGFGKTDQLHWSVLHTVLVVHWPCPYSYTPWLAGLPPARTHFPGWLLAAVFRRR